MSLGRNCSALSNSFLTVALASFVFKRAFELHSNLMVLLFVAIMATPLSLAISAIITRSRKWGDLFLAATGLLSLACCAHLAWLAWGAAPLLSLMFVGFGLASFNGWPVPQPGSRYDQLTKLVPGLFHRAISHISLSRLGSKAGW